MDLVAPFRFGLVEHGLYRGAYPTLKNYRFLRRLGLKTIVSLIPEPPVVDLVEFCQFEQIHSLHFPVQKFTGDVTVASSVIANILEVLISSSNFPLYLHCLDGSNITGLVVMCLRKLQNWTLQACYLEFRRYQRDRIILVTESKFIQKFAHVEHLILRIPSPLPTWLWQGRREGLLNHPSMRIVHKGDGMKKKKKIKSRWYYHQ